MMIGGLLVDFLQQGGTMQYIAGTKVVPPSYKLLDNPINYFDITPIRPITEGNKSYT